MIVMRVDDAAGRGNLWGQSPFYWIKTANKYNLKPWLGLMIYNLTPEAIKELRGHISEGNASNTPHILGRPNRTNVKELNIENYINPKLKSDRPDIYEGAGMYYNPDAIPLREDTYDEFIYFNHQKGIPWDDEEAKKGLDAVDKWYAQNKIPMSKYFVAHWGELGSNVIDHVAEKWKMEYIINQYHDINLPYTDSTKWRIGGPFRLYEEPGTITNNPRLRGGLNPFYYADFLTLNGHTFFNCVTEIKDDAGYEWAPNNDVDATVGRGIRQVKRAMDAMVLPFLFTHETDYIFKIRPENWDEELKRITTFFMPYQPLYLTVDDGLRIVRTTKTSRISRAITDDARKSIEVDFTGKADTTNYFYLFTENNGEIKQELKTVRQFDNNSKVTFSVK